METNKNEVYPHLLWVTLWRESGLSFVSKEIDFPVATSTAEITRVFRVLGGQMGKHLPAGEFRAELFLQEGMILVAACHMKDGAIQSMDIHRVVSENDGTGHLN